MIELVKPVAGMSIWGGAVVGVVWLLGKLVDRYKPTGERRVEEFDFAERRLRALRDEIEQTRAAHRAEMAAMQADITELRQSISKMSRERHLFFNAITRCGLEHPATSDWWATELSDIAMKLDR